MWKRPKNVSKIVDALRNQDHPVEIFLWNNNPEVDYSNMDVDWVVNSERNVYAWGLPFMMSHAKGEVICKMDDDYQPTGPAIKMGYDAVDQDPRRVYGSQGVDVKPNSTYSQSLDVKFERPDQTLPVDVVKGRIMFFHAASVRKLMPLPVIRQVYGDKHFDLAVNFALANERHYHRVIGNLWKYMVNLREGDEAISADPKHYAVRNEITRRWITQCSMTMTQ